MSEVITDIKKAPGELMHVKGLVIGFMFLILVLILEAYKPGLITGPIKSLLSMVGIKSA